MPISSVSITEVRPTANSVEADFTAQGLIFSGTATLTGFLEVVDGGFSPTILASSPIEESQGADTASYTYSVDVSDVPAGDYTLRVVWDDESGNSGRDSTSVTIPEQDTGGGGGGGDDLLLSDLTLTCSLSTFDAEVGDTVTVEYDIEGFAPPATSYAVDVDLYSNGTYISTLTEGISPNGGGGGEFEVELPEEGNYDFSVEKSNLRQVE
jgi:hypothetical protein